MNRLSKLPRYIVLQKKRGETPLEILEQVEITNLGEHPELQNAPLAYAGRLDPMAEGKLLVLIGDECKKQSSHTKLDKEYEVEIVLDLKTDTGDVLGLAEYGGMSSSETILEKRVRQQHLQCEAFTLAHAEIKKALRRELGAHSRKYSSFFVEDRCKGSRFFCMLWRGNSTQFKSPSTSSISIQ